MSGDRIGDSRTCSQCAGEGRIDKPCLCLWRTIQAVDLAVSEGRWSAQRACAFMETEAESTNHDYECEAWCPSCHGAGEIDDDER